MYAQNPFGDLAHEVYVSCKTGDFIKAVSYFDDSLKSKMDAGQLSYMWGSVEEQMGKMKSLDMRLPWSETNDSLVTWFYPCDFEESI
ncbi:MAG: hypothetical protein IPP34_00370 [Bacteroidetes bacterium]|nr:hypothetical protein [Bacteroidota bacterium]